MGDLFLLVSKIHCPRKVENTAPVLELLLSHPVLHKLLGRDFSQVDEKGGLPSNRRPAGHHLLVEIESSAHFTYHSYYTFPL